MGTGVHMTGAGAPHVDAEARTVAALVIDDDAETRELLAAVIERAGYSTMTAANGQNAIALLGSIRPELVLLDVCMPVMDGATFRQEQRRNPEWLRIPTVVITGAYDEPVLDPAVVAALRKPVLAKDILALVERYCTRR